MTFFRILAILLIVGYGWTQTFVAFGIERPLAWFYSALVQIVVTILIPRKVWRK